MKRISILFVIILSLFILSSCSRIETKNKEDYVDMLYNYHTLGKKDTACIDLRTLDEYGKGHLKGYINYNFEKGTSEEFIIFVTNIYNKDTYIFLIDEAGEYVNIASKLLKDEGYKHIVIYEEGYNSLVEYASNYILVVEGTDDCGC